MPAAFTTHSTLDAPPHLDGKRWTRRSVLTLLLALAALLAGLAWLWPAGRQGPGSLDDVRLVGARGPSCLRLVIADDVSGSMSQFSAARQQALAEFLRWAPNNLRPDDELGVLNFAAEAKWDRQPAEIGVNRRSSGVTAIDGQNTLLTPVLSLVSALPSSPCDTELLLLSDAQLSDLPVDATAGRGALLDRNVHGIALLVPGSAIQVPSQWTQAFPEAEPRVFDGLNGQDTGLTFAAAIAQVTGQRLDQK